MSDHELCLAYARQLDAAAPDGDGAEERVLIYGSRTWRDQEPIRDVVMGLNPGTVVIHGGASGADTLAGKWAKAYGLTVQVYPADWQRYGRRAGPVRNQEMLDNGVTRAYGFRMPGESRGTADMTRRLERAGIPHEVRTLDAADGPASADRHGKD